MNNPLGAGKIPLQFLHFFLVGKILFFFDYIQMFILCKGVRFLKSEVFFFSFFLTAFCSVAEPGS